MGKTMLAVVVVVFCSLPVATGKNQAVLEADRPFLRVALSQSATLKCCFRGGDDAVTWKKHVHGGNRTVNAHTVKGSDLVTLGMVSSPPPSCGSLTIKSVQLNDTGLYRCWLNATRVYTHGTYLQVFQPMSKTINLRETTKNKILVTEGILLCLCVLLPSATLLLQSRQKSELEKRKSKKEEENIYQGLNLDDCCAAYDQIECAPARGHYQDVRNVNEEEIQLEKP